MRGLQGVKSCYNEWLRQIQEQNSQIYIMGKNYINVPVEGGTIKEYIDEQRPFSNI